jgi:putative DNA primase/helicase
MVLDPIVNVVGTADSHKNSEVRRALQPLAEFAERHQCAVLGISHFSKGTAGRDPLERVTGSLAFGAAARVVIAAAKLADEDGGGRVMVRAKSNIGPDGGGFRFDLDRTEIPGKPGVIGQRVLWGDPVEGAAREILGTAEAESDQGERNATADAEAFLREELKTGSLPASEIRKLARAAGHADRTLARAKASLRIRSVKAGLRDGWTWE